MINGLFWNIRGIANRASLRRLEKLLHLHSVYFLVIIEPMANVARIDEIRLFLGFSSVLFMQNNKAWIF